VLHTAAFGGKGPGWSGQLTFEVHCPPVMVQVPTGGHSNGSNPGLLQVTVLRMLHTPGTFGHGTPLLQTECVLEQLRRFEQQNCVCPWLHAVAKHAGGGSILLPLQVPKATGQPQLVSVVPLN
jgi:hypothetical protein